MIDINYIRENPEKVKEGIAKKQYDISLVDKVLELDAKRRDLIQKVEELRARRNELAKEGKPSEEGKRIKEELKNLEPELDQITSEYEQVLAEIPNLPLEDVPEGKDQSSNKVVRKWGEPPKFDFEPRDHLELGEALGIIDVERAARVSGTRFGYLRGDGVLLEFALVQYAFKLLTNKGFVPILPPVLIKKEITEGLGYWQHGGNENYYWVHDPEADKGLYLVGTAEHSVVPMHKDEVLESTNLPLRYVAFSSCFRREAGSYGKDTRGILRVHQFDKIEMVSITKPENGDEELEYLLSLEEKLFQSLGIPYQVVQLCTGDLSHPSAKTYDIEAWMPGQGQYREVTSTSTTTDYQSRRLNIKHKEGGKTEFVHMLNGTAFAIGRTIIAILENYQQEDGSILIPEVLQPYLGKDRIA